MACDSATIEALIFANKYGGLSDYDLSVCLASIYGTNASFATAQAALNNAKAMGMAKLSDADLEKCFLAVICH